MIERREARLNKTNKIFYCSINSYDDFDSILGYFVIQVLQLLMTIFTLKITINKTKFSQFKNFKLNKKSLYQVIFNNKIF